MWLEVRPRIAGRLRRTSHPAVRPVCLPRASFAACAAKREVERRLECDRLRMRAVCKTTVRVCEWYRRRLSRAWVLWWSVRSCSRRLCAALGGFWQRETSLSLRYWNRRQDPAGRESSERSSRSGLRPKREGKCGPTRHGGSSSTHSVDLRSNAATHFRLEIACARKARFSEEAALHGLGNKTEAGHHLASKG